MRTIMRLLGLLFMPAPVVTGNRLEIRRRMQAILEGKR